MRKKDEKLIRKVARKKGCKEQQVEAIVDYIDAWLQETYEAERYVKRRRPVGFC